MQSFFQKVMDEIDWELRQFRIKKAKLNIALYLHQALGANQYDAWNAADRLEFKWEKSRLISKLRKEGLTPKEESSLVALIDVLQDVLEQERKPLSPNARKIASALVRKLDVELESISKGGVQ